MAVSRHRGVECIIYEANTQGDRPTDNSETYDAEGDRIHVVQDIDIGSIADTLIPDERSVDRIFEFPGVMVRGTRNTNVTIPVYLTGKGTTTTGGQQVTETALARLLEHCMGGVSRNNTTTAKVGGTHTTTQVELTASTNFAVGQFIGVIDADDDRGTVHLRRVKGLSGDVVTFDRALPFTPADGDVIPGAITIFFDQDVLEDSSAAADRTHSIFIRKGASSTAVLELLGCKAALGLAGLDKNQLPVCNLQYQVATFLTSADDGTGDRPAISSTPSFNGTLNGAAPISMGLLTKVYCEDYGSESATSSHVAGLEINPGVAVQPITTVTSANENMEGLGGWTIGKPEPTINFQVVPHSQAFHTDLEAGTFKNFMVERRNQEGFSFAISAMQCEVMATPVLGANGEVLAVSVQLKCHEVPDAVGTTDIAKSSLAIGIC